MHNFNGLSNEAKQLIASLNIPAITESETSEFTVNHILDKINSGLNKDDKNRFNKLLENVSSLNATEELSSTSPFISSEMYEYLVNNKSSEQENKIQQGGAKKVKKSEKPIKKSKKGGALNDDDSETSSTSSDSDLENILDSTEEEIKAEKAKKEQNKNKHKKSVKYESESDNMSGGELSYISSSAHTEGGFSESAASKTDENNSHRSIESSSETLSSQSPPSSASSPSSPSPQSVTDENKHMSSRTTSINTDDINMVSDF
jgi:hypothetical protein